MFKSVALLLLAGAAATPAFAQETRPFEGPRVEGILGWDRVQVDGDHEDGVVYGGGIGYDLQRGRAVFGVEGEVTGSSAETCFGNFTVAGDNLCVNAGRDLYVGARAGAAVAPNLLLYAKAGYTNARVRLDYSDGTPATAPDFSIGENLDGVRVGAGAEYLVTRNAYIKAEYRYSNYEQGFSRNQVVAGVGFRF